jgi:hypothetical protein
MDPLRTDAILLSMMRSGEIRGHSAECPFVHQSLLVSDEDPAMTCDLRCRDVNRRTEVLTDEQTFATYQAGFPKSQRLVWNFGTCARKLSFFFSCSCKGTTRSGSATPIFRRKLSPTSRKPVSISSKWHQSQHILVNDANERQLLTFIRVPIPRMSKAIKD